MKQKRNTQLTDGSDCTSRCLEALKEGYFNVDELRFEELLAMGSDIAATLNYYNQDMVRSGNWQGLFNGDEAVVMAKIMSHSLSQLEYQLQYRFEKPIEQLAEYTFSLLQMLNEWYQQLGLSDRNSATTLRQKLAELIREKLLFSAHNTGKIINHLNEKNPDSISVDFSVLDLIWAISDNTEAPLFDKATLPDRQSHYQARCSLREACYAFINGVAYLKRITPALLQQSMGNESHEPSLALFMGFLQLYQHAQQSLNRFTTRHRDFYYQSILQAKPRNAVPEQAHLVFEKSAGFPYVSVAKGTVFLAGKDSNSNDIRYQADHGIEVKNAKVTALHTLYFRRGELTSPERELHYVTRIKRKTLTIQPPMTEDSELMSWPFFGAEKGRAALGDEQDAALGFAVSSPVILLTEGQRKIELVVSLESDREISQKFLIEVLENCCDQTAFFQAFGLLFSRHVLSNEACLNSDDLESIGAGAARLFDYSEYDYLLGLLTKDKKSHLIKLFRKAFNIQLTAESGWVNIDSALFMPLDKGHPAKFGFKVILELSPEVEPIISCNSELHGSEWSVSQPIIRAVLNPASNFCSYSLFDGMFIKKLEIDVSVAGIAALTAANNFGPLDVTKPFNPFGPIPSTNSYLLLGGYEFSRKQINSLTFDIEWGDLPVSNNFASHYQGYSGEVTNDAFIWDLSVLANNQWSSNEVTSVASMGMFESDSLSDELLSEASFTIGLSDQFTPANPTLTQETFAQVATVRNGLFRFKVSAPRTAFGHAEYPVLLSQVLTENAQSKTPKPIPNPPYTPMINRITANYQARASIDFTEQVNVSQHQLLHIHPFGVCAVADDEREQQIPLLPRYEKDGNLFIGIQAPSLSGTLTLFFNLTKDADDVSTTHQADISWCYLTKQGWRSLDRSNILADSTNGFICSGIVSLKLPDDMYDQSPLMEKGRYWLSVGASHYLNSCCSLYSVHCNGVTVTRLAGSEPTALPESRQWSALPSISGLANTVRMGDFVGGRCKEVSSHVMTRLSERLRHKNRATNGWDYERLILEQFDNLQKVKCFNHVASPCARSQPGKVLIAAVMKTDPATIRHDSGVMLNGAELNAIKDFVQGLSSPFAKIEVRNPLYERVQVRCTVRFINGNNSGYNIERLNQDISHYLSPWHHELGYKARFGWRIRKDDVLAFIRALDYVEYVTNFSMLHVVEDDEGLYTLGDTVKSTQDESTVADITPRYPWSLALPFTNHFIEIMDTVRPIPPEVTGVDELEIGNTLIIG